ncbi:MAG: allantoin racemase [Thermomicrobiales bacterium]|jgi:allantoin racemase|nr:allantoin racemase [Thermomicrobiales bacterium]MEA2527978.1 allantoin racemase [Thermomicrobiales bacterium]
MKLRVITPITSHGFASAEDFASIIRSDTELSHVEIDHGPASIESDYDEMLATPDTVAKIIQAEQDGMDAVIINCMGDPGMQAGREKVSIPVIGPCEATMHVASMLGHTFSVITVLKSLRPVFENQAKIYGVRDKLASVRAVEIPVLELEDDRDRLVHALADEAQAAIEQDGAHVMLFGCTGMIGAAAAVERELAARGYPSVPVIDSMVWAIKMAEAIADMGLRHSKLSWPEPPAKRIAGFEFLRSPVAVAAD